MSGSDHVDLDPQWVDLAMLAITGLKTELRAAKAELERLALVCRDHELGADAGRAMTAAQRIGAALRDD